MQKRLEPTSFLKTLKNCEEAGKGEKEH